jgi:hypothetical protein
MSDQLPLEELEALVAPFLASDLAHEVANHYRERIGYGVAPGPATASVIETFRDLIGDPDEGPVIFLALASVQLQHGRLIGPVRDAAIALIESGDAQRAWRPTDANLLRQRRDALLKIADQLRAAHVDL